MKDGSCGEEKMLPFDAKKKSESNEACLTMGP